MKKIKKYPPKNIFLKTSESAGIYSCLAAAAAANNPQIIELCHIVLHDGGVVAQLTAKVLVVPHPQVHHRPVVNVAQRYHLKQTVSGEFLRYF
jgi:hypothetical protein